MQTDKRPDYFVHNGHVVMVQPSDGGLSMMCRRDGCEGVTRFEAVIEASEYGYTVFKQKKHETTNAVSDVEVQPTVTLAQAWSRAASFVTSAHCL